MSHNSSPLGEFNDGSEISLIDILRFIKRAWKTIALAGVLGLAGAGTYLLVTPNQYQAVVNIVMGRISPTGANIEEPVALINRMSLPSSFDAAMIQACGLQESGNPAVQLAKSIKLSIPKGVGNVVELKVTSSNSDLAQNCANAVYEAIAKSQTQVIDSSAQKSHLKKQARLSMVEGRLTQDKILLGKAEQSKNGLTPTYFALLSEIRALEDERERLMEALGAKEEVMAALQSPIYVADNPVHPKKVISLVAGLFSGLFLGLLIALARQLVAKLKMEAGGAW